MEIHLDPYAENLIERHLRSGRYQSAEQVVLSALESLRVNEQLPPQGEERRQAIQQMLDFAGKHGFTLGPESRTRDLIHEGHKR